MIKIFILALLVSCNNDDNNIVNKNNTTNLGYNKLSSVSNIESVKAIEDLVAFWDFNTLSLDRKHYVAYSNIGSFDPNLYPIYLKNFSDYRTKNYNNTEWGITYPNIPIHEDSTGPFGHSLKIDAGNLFARVLRSDFKDNELGKIHGKQPFTLIAWVKFHGTNTHSITGIWDEGNEENPSRKIFKQYSGQRQFSLFTKNFEGQARLFSHFSATGAATFPQRTNQYAQVRSIDGGNLMNLSTDNWYQLAMVYDGEEVTSYINGIHTPFSYPSGHQNKAGKLIYNDLFDPMANPESFVPVSNENKNHLSYRDTDFKIYSPNDLMIKFDYQGDVFERYVNVKINGNNIVNIVYGYIGSKGIDHGSGYSVKYRVYDKNSTQSQIDLIPIKDFTINSNGIGSTFINEPISVGTTVLEVSLYKNNTLLKGENVSANRNPEGMIKRVLGSGGHFSFGQVVHSGLCKGTQAHLDGVAVFKRALTPDQLRVISFIE